MAAVAPNATLQFGRVVDDLPVLEGLCGKQMAGQQIAFLQELSEGIGGAMVHRTELTVIEKLRYIHQRLIDGYIAGRDPAILARATSIVNSGFDAPILDIGF